jgi:virginiamycin B lyase
MRSSGSRGFWPGARSERRVTFSPRAVAPARRWFILLAACLVPTLALPAQAASLGTLKEFRLPTSTDPHQVTTASDGNVWFTVQGAFNEVTFQNPGQVARVTPKGNITEFDVCDSCITNDIVEGPDGILYISDNDGHLRRITTSGDLLSSVRVGDEVFGDPLAGVAADSTSIWFADPFNSRIGRYNVFTAAFTFYPAAEVDDVAVAADGTVWFTGSNEIGELDPAVGVVSTTTLSGEGRGIAIAPNGTVWVTEIFADLIGRLTPSTNGPHHLQEFPTAANATPLGIAAADDGNVWFTQNLRGNIARITADGVITEATRSIDFSDPKRPDPIGITIGPTGNPWYAESLVDKVATFRLR